MTETDEQKEERRKSRVTLSDGSVADEDIHDAMDQIIDMYGLRDDLGERALIVPDIKMHEPAMPFGAMVPANETRWEDGAQIATWLDRAARRRKIFVRREKTPQLIKMHDRYRNRGWGYEGEPPIAIVREKRREWHVITGDGHKAGIGIPICQRPNFTEAMAAARAVASQEMPEVLLGSNPVIEIDAASHNGVDDARELRERAFFAPVRDRFKVYIIDEAHMVTTAAFNALLKLVEEPPDFLVFIFATTEPDKVLTTIRSRTHHYPFRLIPPQTLRAHLERIVAAEGIAVEPPVLPLVVRAGGGSARDSLSILDQLLAGAGPDGVTYARAVGLLGVTDGALLDDMIDALAAGDARRGLRNGGPGCRGRATTRAVSPWTCSTRFRDLILLDAVPDAGERGLVDVPQDQLAHMTDQSASPRGRHADPLRRDRAHRADRDARHHLAAAGARVAVRPHAAARCHRRFRRRAPAARAARAADGRRAGRPRRRRPQCLKRRRRRAVPEATPRRRRRRGEAMTGRSPPAAPTPARRTRPSPRHPITTRGAGTIDSHGPGRAGEPDSGRRAAGRRTTRP